MGNWKRWGQALKREKSREATFVGAQGKASFFLLCLIQSVWLLCRTRIVSPAFKMRKLKLRGIDGHAQGRWLVAEPRFQARCAWPHGPQLLLHLLTVPGVMGLACPGTHCTWGVAPTFPVTCCVTLGLSLPSLGLSFLFHKMWRWVGWSPRPPLTVCLWVCDNQKAKHRTRLIHC